MLYIPILGALLEATGMIIEKRIIRKKCMNYKNYIVYGFFAIAVISLPFLLFFWKLKPEAFYLKNLLIFISIVLTSLIANVFIFYSLKRENVSELEPIRLTQPLFTVLLAFFLSFFIPIYSNEKNPLILFLAIVASTTLIIAHFDTNKNKLIFDKYILAAILGSFFFAVELVLSKMILPYFSPWTFYFIRCLFIFLIALLIFRPDFKKIDKQTHYLTWITAFIWIIYRVILYRGYESLGIIFTTILLILSPIFIFIFARIFLKEKITKKQIVSSIIIVLCVVIASFQETFIKIFNNLLTIYFK